MSGGFASKYPNIIERFKDEGHTIALHSLRHKNAMLQGPFETSRDLNKSLEIMQNFDTEIKFYRPPWGDLNLVLLYKLKKANVKLILWNVMAEDWEKDTTPEIIADKLLKRVKNGSIICLHDGRGSNMAPKRTIEALRKVIPIFLEKGYIFKTIYEYEN